MSTQFSDTFTRADAANLGANYTSLGSPFTLVSNQGAAPASGGSDYVNAATPGAACWAQVTAAVNVAAANYLGVGLRLNTGTFNGYYAAWDTGGTSIYRIDGGTPTALGATGLTPPANGDAVRLEMHGSSLRLYYNGTLQATRTDATYSAAGSVLLLGAGTAARIDNLSLGTLPTLSSPTPSGTLGTQNTATIGCTTDEAAGSLYVVVDQGSLAAVTAAQIIAGQDAGGAAADASGNATVSTTTPSVGVTGLLASTTYNYAILQVSGGNSNIVTGSFTTAASTTPTINSTSSSTPQKGAALTITGSTFGASQGTQEVRIGGQVQPILSWANTSIVVRAVDRGSNKYGVAVNVEIWDGTLQSNSYALASLQPQAGWDFVDIASLGTTGLLDVSPPLAVGDQVAWRDWSGAVDIGSDGVPNAQHWVGEFEVEVWTPGDGWGPVALQIIDLGTPNPRLIDHLFDGGLFVGNAEAAEIQLWEAFGPFATTEAALVLLAGGVWQFNSAAGLTELKLYLSTAGQIVARTTPVSGDRLLTLSGGVLQAATPAP